MLFYPALAFALWLGLSGPADALAARKPAAGEPAPVVVTARTLTADNQKRLVIYKKDVVVKRGAMTLYADEVVIHLAEGGKGEAQDTDPLFSGAGGIDTIEARGGVKIVMDDKTATSGKAVYYADRERIVMTGDPRVWQGANVLSGTSITLNIPEDTISVEDARTVLYPKDYPGAAQKP
jgi:lipopolysaccharide export system protein LptA